MKIDSKFGIYIDENGLPNNHRIQENDKREYINFFNKKNEDGTFSIMIENVEKKLTRVEVLKKIKEIYENVLDILYQFNLEKINKSKINENLLFTFPEQTPTLYSDSYCFLRKLELAFNDYLYENNQELINKTYYSKKREPSDNIELLKTALTDLYVYQTIVLDNGNILDEVQNLKSLRQKSLNNNVFNTLKQCVSEVYRNYEDLEGCVIKEQNGYFLDVDKNTLCVKKEPTYFTTNHELLNIFNIDSERMELKTDKLSGVYIFVRDSLGFIDTTKYDEIEKHVPTPNEKIESRYEEVTFVNFSHIVNSSGAKLKYYGANLEEVSKEKDLEILSNSFKNLLSTMYSLNLYNINSSKEDENPLIKQSLFLINEMLEKNNKEKITIEYKKIDEKNALEKIIENHGNIIVSLSEFENKEYLLIKRALRSLMTETFSEIGYKKIEDLNTKYFHIERIEECGKEKLFFGYKSLDIDLRSLISDSEKIKAIELPEITSRKRKNNGH